MKLNDGLVSMATDMGIKTNNRRYQKGRVLSDKELSDMYQDNWIVGKFVDKVAQDVTKLPRNIESDLDEADLQSIERVEKRLKVTKVREEAFKLARLHGDAMVVAITSFEDSETPKDYLESALDLENERIIRFLVLDKTAYKPYDSKLIEEDIQNPNFGRPVHYQITGNLKVHHSRVHRVIAKDPPFNKRNSAKGMYGISDVQGIYHALQIHDAIVLNISDLVEESKTDVVQIDGFNEGVKAGLESQYIQVAWAMKTIKSSQNMMLIDALAKWEQKEITFTGLVDLWKQSMNELAGAMWMPITLVFGQSASGFASGEEDGRNYRDDINSLQESRDRPLYEFIDKFTLDDVKLKKTNIEWSFSYPSIEEKSMLTIADVLQKLASALQILLQEGVINEAQAAAEIKRLGLVYSIDDEHIKGLYSALEELKAAKGREETETGNAKQESRSLLPETAI